MKYLLALIVTLLATAATAQTDDCYPGLGLCEDEVTINTPLPARINIGTPEDNGDTTNSGQTAQTLPANPVCIVYDVRPPDAWLALRTEPSTKRGTRLYKLPSGTRIEMMGPREGAWHLVRVPDGTVGWVSWYKDRWIAC